MKILKLNAKPVNFKALMLCTALIFCGINIFGQSITWQRTYDGRDGVADGGYAVCKADGDNFYICGYTTFLPNNKRVYVIKVNLLGDTLWSRSLQIGTTSTGGSCLSSVTSSDDGCVLTGETTYAFTIKVNKYGEVIWNINYGLFGKQLYEIINTSDGGYIACGRDYEDFNDNAFLLKIDSIGNLQWHKTYYSTYWKNFESIVESYNNDGYLIGGFNKNFQTDTAKSFLLKVNYNGDSLWQKQYELNVISNVKCINKITAGYLIGSTNLINNMVNYSILKVDEMGDILLQRTIKTTNNLLILNDLKIINSNKFVIAGRYGSIGHIFTVDSNGIMQREKFYYSPDFLTIRSILPISNGDILFAGEVDFDSILTKKDVYALRTDSLLNAPPPIGINNLNNNTPKYFKLFQNYPNPFNPETIIHFQMAKKSNIKITLYNVTGKYIAELFSGPKEIGIHKLNINFNNLELSTGIYFLKFKTETGQSETIKLAFIK